MNPIGLVDIAQQHAELRSELEQALLAVLDKGAFILGPFAASFEEAFAKALDVPHAMGVNSGTDALLLALDAVRERRGPGQVITTPFTFFATAESVLQAGHDVVFADIEPDSFNLDPQAVAAARTDATVAVMPVHIFGRCADIDALPQDLDLVEDAAQAIGATLRGRKAGGLGTVAGFSFYPTKNLGAAGDAGAVTTTHDDMAQRIRSLRAHGEVFAPTERSYRYERIGRNSRLDGFQAAVLQVKLARLDTWQARREANARFYDEALANIDGVMPPARAPAGDRHVYHQYVLRAQRRDALRDHLKSREIHTRAFYPEPLHVTPALRDELGYKEGAFPEAERACGEVLSLPVHAHLSNGDRERVVTAVRDFYGA